MLGMTSELEAHAGDLPIPLPLGQGLTLCPPRRMTCWLLSPPESCPGSFLNKRFLRVFQSSRLFRARDPCPRYFSSAIITPQTPQVLGLPQSLGIPGKTQRPPSPTPRSRGAAVPLPAASGLRPVTWPRSCFLLCRTRTSAATTGCCNEFLRSHV